MLSKCHVYSLSTSFPLSPSLSLSLSLPPPLSPSLSLSLPPSLPSLRLSLRLSFPLSLPPSLLLSSFLPPSLSLSLSPFLSSRQFKSLMFMLDAFNCYQLNQKYLKYKPVNSVKENTKEWWKYAYDAVLQEHVKGRLYMWSWKRMKEHRSVCMYTYLKSAFNCMY